MPYLFGVCVGDSPSIVTSFHGFVNHTVTVYDALFGASKIGEQLTKLNWKDIILQILSGLEQLHSRHKVLHNDLKNDNVVLNQTLSGTGAVIIDFGKACARN